MYRRIHVRLASVETQIAGAKKAEQSRRLVARTLLVEVPSEWADSEQPGSGNFTGSASSTRA